MGIFHALKIWMTLQVLYVSYLKQICISVSAEKDNPNVINRFIFLI